MQWNLISGIDNLWCSKNSNEYRALFCRSWISSFTASGRQLRSCRCSETWSQGSTICDNYDFFIIFEDIAFSLVLKIFEVLSRSYIWSLKMSENYFSNKYWLSNRNQLIFFVYTMSEIWIYQSNLTNHWISVIIE